MEKGTQLVNEKNIYDIAIGKKKNFECSQTAGDKKERGGSRGDVLPLPYQVP